MIGTGPVPTRAGRGQAGVLPALLLALAALMVLPAPLWLSEPWLPLLAWPAAAALVVASGRIFGCGLGRAGLGRCVRSALVLFGLVWLLLVLLLAWPLSTVLIRPALAPVLLLAALAGLALSLLWRGWPAIREAARGSSTVGDLLSAVDEAAAPPTLPMLPMALLWLLALLPLPLLLLFADRLYPWREFLLIAQAALVPAAALISAVVARKQVSRPAIREPAPALVAEAVAVEVVEAAEQADASLEDRLYAAAAAGRVEQALLLLDQGANAHALPAPDDLDQRTLAMLAAVLPDLRLLRRLIASGVDLNRGHAGLTPLLAATRDSWQGRGEAVMTLLANGADPRQADPDGATPLHHAARSTDPAVAVLLLDAGALVDALDNAGNSPLAVACSVGNWRLARLLLQRRASCEPSGGRPALLAAAEIEDDPAGVELLLKHKARVNARDRAGRTALVQACEAGNADIIQSLLAAGADVDAADGTGRGPLLVAAQGGRVGILKALAQARPDPGVHLNDGRNALALLAGSDGVGPEAVDLLIGLGVDPAQTDSQGRRPIDHLIAAGRWQLVLALEPGHPLPASLSEQWLDEPGEHSPLELLRRALNRDLIGKADKVNALAPICVEHANMLLRELSTTASSSALVWLLDHGADAELRDAGGDSPAFALLDRGPQALIALRCLLDRGHGFSGRGGLARFLCAALEQDVPAPAAESLALEMLERGADPFGGDGSGQPPLHSAVALSWHRLVRRLLERGVHVNARNRLGLTALHQASTGGDEHGVRLLIEHGAAPDLPAPDGQTACGLALAAGRGDLVRWLNWTLWRPPGRRLAPADLPAAVMIGDRDAAIRLLDLGLPVNGVDGQGCTALLRACGGGHDDLVALLLERSADPAIAANTGATPLSAALSMRQHRIVERLLAAGARVDQALPGAITPLMLASALGFPELAETLLSAGASVHARDDQGLTALHCAAMYAFQARDASRAQRTLEALLDAGAALDVVTETGHTPLLLALGARAEPGVSCREDIVSSVLERLLSAGASLLVRDGKGFGPLHLAALHGLAAVLRRLLAAGADPDARDNHNRPPREIAILRGFVDIAAEFKAPDKSVSMARFLRRPQP